MPRSGFALLCTMEMAPEPRCSSAAQGWKGCQAGETAPCLPKGPLKSFSGLLGLDRCLHFPWLHKDF